MILSAVLGCQIDKFQSSLCRPQLDFAKDWYRSGIRTGIWRIGELSWHMLHKQAVQAHNTRMSSKVERAARTVRCSCSSFLKACCHCGSCCCNVVRSIFKEAGYAIEKAFSSQQPSTGIRASRTCACNALENGRLCAPNSRKQLTLFLYGQPPRQLSLG